MTKLLTRAEHFLRTWLDCTTCSRGNLRSIHWASEDGRFVVLKHAGHSEYTGRFGTGRAWCGTYYCLYDLDNVGKINIFGEPSLLKVEGRWTTKAQRAAEELISNARRSLPKDSR